MKPIVVSILCIVILSLPVQAGMHDVEIGVSISRSDDLELFDEIAADHGASLNANWHFNDRLSAELTIATFESDIGQPGVFGQRVGSMRWYPIVLSAHVHFRPGGKVHPYLGAGLSYVLSDSSVAGFSVRQRVSPAPGVGAAFDLGSNWQLAIDAKWLRFDGSKSGGEWSSSQIMTSLGVRFRFSRVTGKPAPEEPE